TTGGKVSIPATGGFTQTDGTTTVTLNTWHRIDAAIDSAASGIGRIWLDGNLEGDTTHTGATGPITIYRNKSVLAGFTTYHDDVLITDQLVRPPGGRSVVRQGLSTTPTDNAWTKTSGSTIDTVWNQVPYTLPINANTGSTTSALSQTMNTQSLTVE